MERTVPSTASEEVELYLRTYYSLLRTTAEVKIRTLEEVHAGMNSLLHPKARGTSPDMSAFIYSSLRLPSDMPQVRLVVLGQSTEVFVDEGYDVEREWQRVESPARRRRCYFDGQETLACLIASRSDIDDVIPILTAYQIEWNKIHHLLNPVSSILYDFDGDESSWYYLADTLEISLNDIRRLQTIWGEKFKDYLHCIADTPLRLGVRLLSGSLSEYRRATHSWWENIEKSYPELGDRPVYFISSNPHSLLNLLSGYALQHQEKLVEFINLPDNAELLAEWEDILAREVPSSRENFLYYVLKKCQQSPYGEDVVREQLAYEGDLGIVRIPTEHYFDIEAQVFELSKMDLMRMDPRAQVLGLTDLKESDALLVNIDYPLGLSAYNILSEVADNVGRILGVYVMGKAATLNGVVGDVMIPKVVHDEHSQSTYIFPNAFSAADVSPYLIYGTVLDNQKSVSVRGPFLQNAHYMDVFYREGYTDIEMEAGPFLSAVYEMYRPQRHPENEIVNLYGLPFDLGIVHYASDTPLSKGKNLGAGSLSYFGVDSTYATTLAILRRILTLEGKRLSETVYPPLATDL
jgi:hypothetical protein